MNQFVSIFFYILFCFSTPLFAQDITTFAGDGRGGYNGDDIPATAASIGYNNSVITDNHGNVYIAEELSRIRKVDASGIITTFAGNGFNGYSGDNGPAIAAQISVPYGMVFDRSGNLYFADGYRIRKIDTAGIITTIAGNGTNTCTGDDGPAKLATLAPVFLSFDKDGNLYFTDNFNFNVRVIDTSGFIHHVAGVDGYFAYSGDGGPANTAGMYFPYGIAIDTRNNIYVSELDGRIRKIDTAGIINTIAGKGIVGYTGDNGPADSATISAGALCIDAAGNILFGDGDSHHIRKIDTAGIITSICGNDTSGYQGDGGPATSAEIGVPYGIATDAAGSIFFSDSYNSVVRKISYPSLGIRMQQNYAAMIIYPNPTKTGKTTITILASVTEKVLIIVSDAMGKQVMKTIERSNEPIYLSIDAPPGIYIVTAICTTGEVSKKLIITGR